MSKRLIFVLMVTGLALIFTVLNLITTILDGSLESIIYLYFLAVGASLVVAYRKDKEGVFDSLLLMFWVPQCIAIYSGNIAYKLSAGLNFSLTFTESHGSNDLSGFSVNMVAVLVVLMVVYRYAAKALDKWFWGYEE